MAHHRYPPGAIARIRRGPIQGHFIQAISYAEFKERYLGILNEDDPDAMGTVYWKAPDGVIQRRSLGSMSSGNLERMTVAVTKEGSRRRWYFATDEKAYEFMGDSRAVDADQYKLVRLPHAEGETDTHWADGTFKCDITAGLNVGISRADQHAAALDAIAVERSHEAQSQREREEWGNKS